MSDPTTFVPVRRLISDPGFVPASPWIATDASRNYNRRTPYWYQPRGTLAPYQFGVHGLGRLGACCASCAQGKACEGQAAGCLGGVPVRVQDLGAFDIMSVVSSAQSHTQGYAVPVAIGATVGYLTDKKSGLVLGAVAGAALKWAYGRYISPVVSSFGVDGFRDDIRFNPAMSPLDSPLDRSAFRFLQLILLTGVTTLAVKVLRKRSRKANGRKNGRRRNPGKARLSIKSHTYRGKPGFLLFGRDASGHGGIRIFTRTREGAEEMRDAMKTGDDAHAQAVQTRVFQRESPEVWNRVRFGKKE